MFSRRVPLRSRVSIPWQTASLRAAGILSAVFVLGGCTISYRNQHRSDSLRIYHNGAHDHVPGLNPSWAEGAIETLAHEFGLHDDGVTPVTVYVDCKSGAARGSHFNRFTQSIVLEEGQASLPFLFVHELTHLLLDQIDSSPPYWVDQGLAEYMESRAYVAQRIPALGLGPAFLDRSGEAVRTIGVTSSSRFRDYFSSEAIDGGWGWAVPMIHYLLRERWARWPLASRIRRLVELTPADLDELSVGFLDYCRAYDDARELRGDYRTSEGDVRLALLSELSRRFPQRHRAVLEALHADEESSHWRDVLARRILAEVGASEAGEVFDRLTPGLAPQPLGEMSPHASRALVRHLLAKEGFDPSHPQFRLALILIAREPIAREILSRERALGWFLRWPEAASFLASWRDVQEDLLGRLPELDDVQLRVFLEATRLVSFSSEGLFARGAWPLGWWLTGGRDDAATRLPASGISTLMGSLDLEDRMFAVNRLEAPRRARIRDRLERFLESAGGRPGGAASVRAALLAAYLGAELSIESLAGFASAGEDGVAFACLFLEPRPCLDARRFFNGRFREVDRLARGREATLAYYAPLLGLDVLRSTLVSFLGDSARGDRALASLALFGGTEEITRWLAEHLEREPITDTVAFYLQQAGLADLCLRTDRSDTRVEVRMDLDCRPVPLDPTAIRSRLGPPAAP